MRRVATAFGVGLGIAMLIGVRMLGSKVFYDPLIEFYHGEYKSLPFPELDFVRYGLNIVLRFSVNSAISLGIIFLLFRNLKHVFISSWILTAVGIIATCVLLFLLIVIDDPSKQAVFYVRRLLIHPLMLFILVPALYFQELNNRKESTLN